MGAVTVHVPTSRCVFAAIEVLYGMGGVGEYLVVAATYIEYDVGFVFGH